MFSGWLTMSRILIAILALSCAVLPRAAKTSVPKFKWGQNKELLFVSVMVRDLNKDSVVVTLPSEGDLHFHAQNSAGQEMALDLPLREDVKVASLKWEIAPRPDKHGTAVLITVNKVHQHRWDLLVMNPKKFKGSLDKDWTREDASLEPEEEVPYAEDHASYMTSVTEKNLQKTLSKFSTVILNVRYPWCTLCKSGDDAFAKAAKEAKMRGKKEKTWKKIGFAVVDAREQRGLARRFGARCDDKCEYKAVSEDEEGHSVLKSAWSESELLTSVSKYLRPAVQKLAAASEAEAIKESNTTCFAGFASEQDPKYALFKKVAGLMRGELVFAATFGAESNLEVWPHKQNHSWKYDGTWSDNGTAFHEWLKPRAIPLIQPYDWQLRDTYETLGLPLAKIWLDDADKSEAALQKIVLHAVRRVAKKFIGKLAFVEMKKSSHSYELRDFGLNQPEEYPAFGIASNASYDAVKFGFDITPEAAASSADFWKDTDGAIDRISSFCDQVLAGTWPEAHETGPAHTNWTAGEVKRLAWKTWREVENPEVPLLLEVYGKYRTDNDKRLKEAENLAKVLASHSAGVTVAAYDTADNYWPTGKFSREKYSSDTEWFWVAKPSTASDGPALTKLTKPKKDAPMKTVLEFLKKQSGLDIDVADTFAKFEAEMQANPPSTTTTTPFVPPADSDGSAFTQSFTAGGEL